MESQSLPGFERWRVYTGEGKGGPDPMRKPVSSRPLPLNTYITYIPNSTPLFKESLDILNIPITLTLTILYVS